jgi:hypothetical protein
MYVSAREKGQTSDISTRVRADDHDVEHTSTKNVLMNADRTDNSGQVFMRNVSVKQSKTQDDQISDAI